MGDLSLKREVAGTRAANGVLEKTAELSAISVEGKFLRRGGKTFRVRGVTYGPFAPDEDGCEYGRRDQVEADFSQMAAYGLNCVRVYTPPPRWLLDIAARNGLYVMVGLPWEQHVAFLDEPGRAEQIVKRVRGAIRTCADHPAVFCFAIGNEIPATIVRWHGKHAIESFLHRLYRTAKTEAPDKLITYVNYPSTEYLDVSFCDFFCFNVYLEDRKRMEAYLARLQNIAGDYPLLLAEIGLDTQRNGEERQAEVLSWQIETAFQGGAAGLFLFAWTDEWYRGGHEIEDWSFGLTTRTREPKIALDTIRRKFEESPFGRETDWPMISVLVCTYNGSATIRECLRGLSRLTYPNYETIVVSDGSTDETCRIVEEFEGVTLIALETNAGLSNARNVAAHEARGEIVAYIDDDAYPEPDWLHHIAHSFKTTDFAGIGGPNIPPPGAGLVSDCVASSPGGPTHVLLSDTVAEHIPGCNMAYRREALMEIGGFDSAFWIAGDDVDFCWRLQSAGYTIGYNPAAMVWHHRRNSVRAYLRQQRNYGRAEAMLERKWPQKYNTMGHVPWTGRIYGRMGSRHFLPGRSRIYQGMWGLAPFQRIYEPNANILSALVCMPEWYLVTIALGFLCVLGVFWTPLLFALPLLVIVLSLPALHACLCARSARFDPSAKGRLWQKRALTTMLTWLQPIVRLIGRVERGLTPWRSFGARDPMLPVQRSWALWYEGWQPYDAHLRKLYETLRSRGAVVRRGGNFDRHDILVRGGVLGAVRCLLGVEEHGEGKQLVRYRATPAPRRQGIYLSAFFVCLGLIALSNNSITVFGVLTLAAVLVVLRALYETGKAMGALNQVLTEDDHYFEKKQS